jgi:hypothetical protein
LKNQSLLLCLYCCHCSCGFIAKNCHGCRKLTKLLLCDLEFECVLRVRSCYLLVPRCSLADFRSLNLCVLAEGFIHVCQLSSIF